MASKFPPHSDCPLVILPHIPAVLNYVLLDHSSLPPKTKGINIFFLNVVNETVSM